MYEINISLDLKFKVYKKNILYEIMFVSITVIYN